MSYSSPGFVSMSESWRMNRKVDELELKADVRVKLGKSLFPRSWCW
jgi:hypothetical protein